MFKEISYGFHWGSPLRMFFWKNNVLIGGSWMKKLILLIVSALLTLALAIPAMANGTHSKEDVLNSASTTLPLDTGMQTHIAAQPDARATDYIATGLFDPGLAVVMVNDNVIAAVSNSALEASQSNETNEAAIAFTQTAVLPNQMSPDIVVAHIGSWPMSPLASSWLGLDNSVVGYREILYLGKGL